MAARRARLGGADRLRPDQTAPILTFNPPGGRASKAPACRWKGSSCASGRPRTPSPATARSRPRVRTCSPAIGTIPRPRPRPSRTTATSARATSATSDDGYLYIVGRSKELIVLRAARTSFPTRSRRSTARPRRSGRSRCWSTTTAWWPCSCPIRKPCARSRRRSCTSISARGRAAVARAAVVRAHRRLRDHARAPATDADRQAAPARAARDLRPGEVGGGAAGARGGRDRGRPRAARDAPCRSRSGPGSRSASEATR